MKQTNLLYCWSKMSGIRAVKSIGLVIAFVFLCLGSQSANAQTMVEAGELQSATIIQLVQTEMNSLEVEMKTPAAGVKVDRNEQLIAFYKNVLDEFTNGGDLKEELLNVSNVGTYYTAVGNAYSETVASEAQPIVADAAVKEFALLITPLDFRSANVNDMNSIFNYLRTLKNQ